jgi:lysophospholipase L1-like esterase
MGRGPYDPTRVADINSQILFLPDEFRLPLVGFSGLPKAASGALQPELTTDGVHLTAAGYEEWLSFLSQSVCRTAARRQ